KNLLEGYFEMGPIYLYGFLALNFFTAFTSIAGVSFVTGALLKNLTAGPGGLVSWSAGVMALCACLLVWGQYRLLDRFMKWLMSLLFVATVVAFLAALFASPAVDPSFDGPGAFTWESLPFLIALMGWMPAPVEMAVWQSLW